MRTLAALATATALVCGGVAVAPIPAASAATCTLTMEPEAFGAASDAAHLYLEREANLIYARYGSFVEAFPEVRSVESGVRRRILEEALGIYIDDAHFADPTTTEHAYALEAFVDLGLPESVANWYLQRHSPTQTTHNPQITEVEHYKDFVATDGQVPVGKDAPDWFAPTGVATDPEAVAEQLTQEFPGLTLADATRWADTLTSTATYENLRAVDRYANYFDQQDAQCEADHAEPTETPTETPQPETDFIPIIAGVLMLLGIFGYGAFAYTHFYA